MKSSPGPTFAGPVSPSLSLCVRM
uniref:Uncharacterized protein n=1 Tax=Anguilla anguilla TaxID=7936 RepID=A0A0E9SZG3_ANGAN